MCNLLKRLCKHPLPDYQTLPSGLILWKYNIIYIAKLLTGGITFSDVYVEDKVKCF